MDRRNRLKKRKKKREMKQEDKAGGRGGKNGEVEQWAGGGKRKEKERWGGSGRVGGIRRGTRVGGGAKSVFVRVHILNTWQCVEMLRESL